VAVPYDGDAAIMMVQLKQRSLLMFPLIMLMVAVTANDLQW
jgi:hypothetical protein